MKKIDLILLMSILMVGILTACGTGGEEAENAGDSDKKVLKMATSADYAPFEYIDTAKGSERFYWGLILRLPMRLQKNWL